MSYQLFNQTAPPAAPAAGKAEVYVDASPTPTLRLIDPAGNDRSLFGVFNFSVAAQAPVAATRTYIAGSALAIPVSKLRVGACFRWRFDLTKTAAGTAASTFDVCFGVNGTTADVARLSFVKPAGTAVADEGFIEITCVIRSIGATGVAVAQFTMSHNLAATGHATVPVVTVNTVSAGFDMTVAGLIAGVCITSGAADAVTIQLVTAEAWNI